MSELVDRLAESKTLGTAPREELAWLAANGTLRHFAEGEILSARGAQVDSMYIVLEGHVAVFVDRSAGRHKISDLLAGDVTGLLPYSRLLHSPVDSIALAPTTLLEIRRDDLPAMIRHCHELTSILVHEMLDRSRDFTSSGLHDEKMVSLGKLSAGLAHELNNPVSAIARNAALLEHRLDDAERATRTLGASKLTESQLASIDTARSACMTKSARGVLSPIEQADREEAIADWLASHDVGEDIAGPLAETRVTFDALEQLAGAVSGAELDAVLRWAAAGYAVRELAADIREAAMRISRLVTAIKGFTHMDQATVAEPVDLVSGLNDTVAVLKSKARLKSISIAINLVDNLPRAHGFAGELNQIWANLIDNALDAAPESGHVEVTASPHGERVVVRVIDDGPGIPPEVRAQIFDPFFTTKGVGHGTGLGLDIVRRLARHNEAEITVESEPGRTEFRVSLPIAHAAS
jgi:signal transduction histidine kinase